MPSRKMTVVGITGTDGKTTSSTLLQWILQHTAGKAVFVGTTGVLIGDQELAGVQKMTSYDPMDLQSILARAYKQGCTYAILEVSSHGLQQLRFLGIKFQLA
ncbi:MAG: hypothetical protein H6765_06945 [Candidatus Peribacteria bacterium]|nr:MAG: hypothetical protein H6765_06945 [Candidatus Peribacteria bacterium]